MVAKSVQKMSSLLLHQTKGDRILVANNTGGFLTNFILRIDWVLSFLISRVKGNGILKCIYSLIPFLKY